MNNSGPFTEVRKSINFEFLLGTYWEKYYNKLLYDEVIFNDSPVNEDIYSHCRGIAEDMAKKIKAELFGQSQCDTFDNLLYFIRGNLPEQIREHFYNIKYNGNVSSHPADSKGFTNTPQEILRQLHECLIWYFQFIEKKPVGKNQVEFVVPNHFVEDIDRDKIIEQQNREINEAKIENEKIESKYRKSVEEKDRKISELKKQLEESRNETNQLIDVTESKEFKQKIEEQEDELQKAKRENDLLKGLLNDIKEFNTFKDVNKIEAIHTLEESISEGLDDVGFKIEKTSNDIRKLKDIFNENQNIPDSIYPLFYKSFINLEGEQLRRIYVTLVKLNIGTILINTAKNKISRSDFDAMQAFIETEARKLTAFSDEEIHLRLYYKLMKICGIGSGCIANEKEFKANCDRIVEFAYSNLEKKKDFNKSPNKVEAINNYYIDKAIYDYNTKYNAEDDATQEKLMDNIFNNFEKLPAEQKKELYDKLGIKGTSEDAIKASMKTVGPSVMLTSLVGLGGFASYTALSSILFGFSQILGVTFSFGVYTGAASLLSFLTGPFMILLLIADGFFIYGQGKKQKADLIPLVVMQICICETSLSIQGNYQENYAKMVALWKEKKKVFEIKSDMEAKILNRINIATSDKNRLESEVSVESKDLELLNEQFNQQKSCFFRDSLMSSDKRRSLKSYKDYHECISKLELIHQNDRSSKGFFNRMASKVKDSTQEYLLKKKINNLENTLILEAIDSGSFNSETTKLRGFQNQIADKQIRITNIKRKIDDETKTINQEKDRLKDIQGELKKIREEYLDISK